jgi:hypothetical protein
MISFSKLNDLIFGTKGILKNQHDFSSVDLKLEMNTRIESKKVAFENTSLFDSLSISDSFIFLSKYYKTEYYTVRSGNVCVFQEKIDNILNELYDEYGALINTGGFHDTLKINRSIRWYLFEVDKISLSLKAKFILVFKNGVTDSKDILIDAANYFIINHLRHRLLQLYCYIITIEEPESMLLVHEDNLILKVINGAKIGTAVIGLIFNRITSHFERGHLISNNFYNYLKSHIEYEEKSIFDLDDNTAKLVSEIENMKFLDWVSIGGLMSDEIATEEISDINEKFDFVYRYISDKALQNLFVSDKLNFIENVVDSVKDFLNDRENYKYKSLNDTIPRRLIRLLQSDYDSLKANPQIDLKEFDRNRIKPIKLNLTVSQLALLFRLLEENDLINLDISKTEYYNTISKAFSTKRSISISSNALGNDYVQPNKKDYEFWNDKFFELAKKVKFRD